MKSFSAEKLIKIFSKFPTVGPRTAARFVFYLIQKPKEEIDELMGAILDLKKNIKTCTLCFNHFESDNRETLCEICSDQRRDKTLLCLVEKEIDLISFEKAKKYKGLYFVLGGTISAVKKSDLEKLRTAALEKRIREHPEIQEIIIAFNPTSEGEATALYVERFLRPLNKKFTHLGRGLPTGAELEYTDEETLRAAIDGRK